MDVQPLLFSTDDMKCCFSSLERDGTRHIEAATEVPTNRVKMWIFKAFSSQQVTSYKLQENYLLIYVLTKRNEIKYSTLLLFIDKFMLIKTRIIT